MSLFNVFRLTILWIIICTFQDFRSLGISENPEVESVKNSGKLVFHTVQNDKVIQTNCKYPEHFDSRSRIERIEIDEKLLEFIRPNSQFRPTSKPEQALNDYQAYCEKEKILFVQKHLLLDTQHFKIEFQHVNHFRLELSCQNDDCFVAETEKAKAFSCEEKIIMASSSFQSLLSFSSCTVFDSTVTTFTTTDHQPFTLSPKSNSTHEETLLRHRISSLATTLPITAADVTLSGQSDSTGYAVAYGGDFNKDGYPDFLIGAPTFSSNAGRAFLVFGATTFPSTINLASLGSLGVTFIGEASSQAGFSVAFAGDINKDGYGDIVIGAPYYSTTAGRVYLVYGKASLATSISLSALGTGGVMCTGASNRQVGYSVSYVGDVNSDGYDDFVIGSILYSGAYSGRGYLIYGGAALASTLSLGSFGSAGILITGESTNNYAFRSVAYLGDINLDSKIDFIIGADGYSSNAGRAYVIFGQASLPSISLGTLGTGGVTITGEATSQAGFSVGRAGDVNKDGIDDILVGAPAFSSDSGRVYLIYGSTTIANTISLSSVGNQGVSFTGEASSRTGSSVSFAGDINKDGYADFLIGASGYSSNTGRVYLIYGKASFAASISLAALDSEGIVLTGLSGSLAGSAVSYVGDTNNDGSADYLIGAAGGTGAVYLTLGLSASPTGQPSSQPSSQPTSRPSVQPSTQPSAQPSVQPSTQPSAQPSVQPSTQPSAQPSVQPSTQPSAQPSVQPSTQPSVQPSTQPSSQPSAEPSAQPTAKPSAQPSAEPSAQPSVQPSTQPSSQPSAEPSAQPSVQPSAQPSSQPTAKPSAQPTTKPSTQPTRKPSAQPSTEPSTRPTSQPTCLPSVHPTALPTLQPTSLPTAAPSDYPSSLPTTQPSAVPSSGPSGFPSLQPSSQPSTQPTAQPSIEPTVQPSIEPIAQPSIQPTTQPSSQPTVQPSMQPSPQPSMQPTSEPSTKPSIQPTAQPSTQPTTQPSSQSTVQPSMQPSPQPSSLPTIHSFSTKKPLSQSSLTTKPSLLSSRLTPTPSSLISEIFTIPFLSNLTNWKVVLSVFGTVPSSPLTDNTIPLFTQSPSRGSNYLVFGSKELNRNKLSVDLSSPTARKVVPMTKISPAFRRDSTSRTVMMMGDINLDHLNDVLLCYPFRVTTNPPLPLSCKLYFGMAANATTFALGSTIISDSLDDRFGFAISTVNDFNQDQRSEIIVCAWYKQCVVLYSRRDWNASFSLAAMTSADGFRIKGDSTISMMGLSVTGLEDINGDHYSDIAISTLSTLESYSIMIVYGKQSNQDVTVGLTINAWSGIRISGERGYFTGLALTGIKDLNNDGYSDLAIGIIPFTNRTITPQQNTVVFFGRSFSTFEGGVTDLSLPDAVTLELKGGGYILSTPGDINRDGIDDLVITTVEDEFSRLSNVYIVTYPTYYDYQITTAPSSQPSSQPTAIPSSSPPTSNPTMGTLPPTKLVTGQPSYSFAPTVENMTYAPTVSPTPKPTKKTNAPRPLPTRKPTSAPTLVITAPPHSSSPTISPTRSPSRSPTMIPTARSARPTTSPTISPSVNRSPTSSPSLSPTLSLSRPFSIYEITDELLLTNYPDLAVERETTTSMLRVKITDLTSLQLREFHFKSHMDTVITGGKGRNLFVPFPVDNVTIQITNFQLRVDQVDLSRYNTLPSLQQLSFSTSPLTFYLPRGQQIVFLNQMNFDLSSSNFIFSASSPASSPSSPSTSITSFDVNKGFFDLIGPGLLTLFSIMGALVVLTLYFSYFSLPQKIRMERKKREEMLRSRKGSEIPMVEGVVRETVASLPSSLRPKESDIEKSLHSIKSSSLDSDSSLFEEMSRSLQFSLLPITPESSNLNESSHSLGSSARVFSSYDLISENNSRTDSVSIASEYSSKHSESSSSSGDSDD